MSFSLSGVPRKGTHNLFHIFNMKGSFYQCVVSYGIQLRIFLQIYDFWSLQPHHLLHRPQPLWSGTRPDPAEGRGNEHPGCTLSLLACIL